MSNMTRKLYTTFGEVSYLDNFTIGQGKTVYRLVNRGTLTDGRKFVTYTDLNHKRTYVRYNVHNVVIKFAN